MRPLEPSFKVVAIFDNDARLKDLRLAGLKVTPYSAAAADRLGRIDIGIIAVPPVAAQEAADALIAMGVRAILNFAPTHVEARGISVYAVDVRSHLRAIAGSLSSRRSHRS